MYNPLDAAAAKPPSSHARSIFSGTFHRFNSRNTYESRYIRPIPRELVIFLPSTVPLSLINSINMLAERYASEEEREERVRSDKLEANVCIASAFFELLMPGFVEIEEEKERRILEKKRRGKEDGRLFGGRGKWQTFSKQNINYTQT